MTGYHGNTPLTRFLATQTLGELRKMKADARNEIESAHTRVQELEADLARIEQAISEKAGGRRHPSNAAKASENGHQSEPGRPMKESIIQILSENQQATWTTQDVYDELLKRSIAPGGDKPLNTVGNRLTELAKAERIHKRGRGAYSLTPAPPENKLSFEEGGENG